MIKPLCLCLFLFTIIFLYVPRISAQTPFQPSAPYYATFFYLWSQNPNTVNPSTQKQENWSYWNDRGHTPSSNWFSNYLPDPYPSVFDPSKELYSSSNQEIVYWQLSKLKEARIEVAIGSWWGINHKSDVAFRNMIKTIMPSASNPYPNLRWAIYYEKEGFGDPTEAEIVADLNYIKTNYASDPSYLKINGKPVIFVYNAAHTGYNALSDFQRWKNARQQTSFYVSLKKDPLSQGANATEMDSWHEYAPASRFGSQSTYYYFVSPGFWLEGNAPRLNRDLPAFTLAVKNMVASNATWKLIQTWNEWGEGSSVEPGVEVTQQLSAAATLNPQGAPFKNNYVDVLAANLPPLEASSNPVTPTISPPATTRDPVIVAVGDIACGPESTASACKEWETSELARQINPAAILILGDNQYESGKYASFTGADPFCQSTPKRCYGPTWGRFKNITYPAVGNHEYLTTNAVGYFDYFNGPGNVNGRAGERTKGYYSFDIGTWHFIALNSNCASAGGCGKGSPQETWLRQDLTAHQNVCVLAYMHHPLYSSGHEGNNTTIKNQLIPLWQALYDNNADVVLNGHSHNYERFSPQDAAGNSDSKGIRAFVVGTGGRNFTGFWTNNLPQSEVKNNNTFGILSMTLHSNSYDWKFVPIAGSTFTDSGSATCTGTSSLPSLSITPTPPAVCAKKSTGDANCDNVIDIVDFEIFRREYTDAEKTKNADFDNNNIVDIVDFEIWRRNYLQ